MGLDQYWFLRPTAEEKAEALITGQDSKLQEIGYHRKHRDLQEFMGETFGTDNCDFTPIGDSELKLIEEWAERQSDSQDPGSHNYYLLNEVIPRIKELLKEGRDIDYHPWW